jgi:hypothetical protein
VLEPYQHQVRNWEGDIYVFGIQLVEGGKNSCTTFRLADSNEDLDCDMLEVIQGKSILRDFLGDDLREARYHLLVELS